MRKNISPDRLAREISEKDIIPVVTGGKFEIIEPYHIDLFEFSAGLGNLLTVILIPGGKLMPDPEKIEILESITVIDRLLYEPGMSLEELISRVFNQGVLVENIEFSPRRESISKNLEFNRFMNGPKIFKLT